MAVHPDNNLFMTVPQLEVPAVLTLYLLDDVVLDAWEGNDAAEDEELSSQVDTEDDNGSRDLNGKVDSSSENDIANEESSSNDSC